MRKLVLLSIVIIFSGVSYCQNLKLPKNFNTIKKVIPYVNSKIKSEFKIMGMNIVIEEDSSDIGVKINDESFINSCEKSNCDSVCKIISSKVKLYCNERSQKFTDNYRFIIVFFKNNNWQKKLKTSVSVYLKKYKYLIKDL